MVDHEGSTPDNAVADNVHKRWIEKVGRNRVTGTPDYKEQSYSQQCGGCRFYLPLDDELGNDWGACSGAGAPFDGQLRFEHDGCDAFEYDTTGRAPFASPEL